MAAPPPPPHPVAARIFASYVRRLARRHFAAVHWNGGAGADPGARRPQGPILFVANHTNWWDGFLACLVTARLGLDFQILMDAANLDRYPLFRRVGALPMHRDSPTRAWDDLAAAAAHLRRPAAALWVFPQGARRPPAERIAGTERGAAQLSAWHDTPLTLWPVAFRYAYLGEQSPEAFAWLGKPLTLGGHEGRSVRGGERRAARRELAARIELALEATVDALDARLATEDRTTMDLLLPGTPSINKRLDRLRHALGLLRGPFDPRNG
ncbi:MAG: lysophospholipid acyltransferase family protein [Gemmatimonadetes bacterium]|nr:lysophospholipid acyltransferase family protein [Gemmatimonadota bacterium]